MATSSTFSWNQRLVCVATYVILEADSLMDQFEDSRVPFAKAGALKLGALRYFPMLPLTGLQLQMLSIDMSRAFLTHLARLYTSNKENPALTSGKIISDIAEVFADGKKTLADLAKAVDDRFKFKDE
jgi:hypothetical protein